LGLQVAHLAADDRLRDVQPARGTAEVPLVGDGDDRAHQSQI